MKHHLLIFLLLCSSFCWAQNLVPNPSFEEYVTCPFSGGMLSNATGWANPTGYSPDYFNACDTGSNASVPVNSFGNTLARTGNAYAGFISMIEIDSREYIQTQLTSHLLSGHNYGVTFYVSFSDVSKYASNTMGVYFSDTAIHSNHPNSVVYLPYVPQIQNNVVSNPLFIRNSWTEIYGEYVADGGEQFMTIGNFKDDASTDTTWVDGGGWNASYHYIDDVSVIDLTPSNVENTVNETIALYPNPTSGLISFSLEANAVVYVFDALGKTCFTIANRSSINQVQSCDLSELPKGVYYLQIVTSEKKITTKFSLIN